MSAASVSGQSLTSGSGDWNDSSIWAGGTVPTLVDAFQIQAGHTVDANGLGLIQDNNASSDVYGTWNIGAGTSVVMGRLNREVLSPNAEININGGDLSVSVFAPNSGSNMTVNLTAGFFTVRDTFAFGNSSGSDRAWTLNITGGTFHLYTGDFNNVARGNAMHLGAGGHIVFENNPPGVTQGMPYTIAQTRHLTRAGSWTGGTITTNTRTIVGNNATRFLHAGTEPSAWSSHPDNVLAISSNSSAQVFTIEDSPAFTANQGILRFRIYSANQNDNDQIVLAGNTALTLTDGVQLQIEGFELSGDINDFIGTSFKLMTAPSYGTLEATIVTDMLVVDGGEYVVTWINNLSTDGTIVIESLTGIAVEGVSLDITEVALEMGVTGTQQLTATVVPANASNSAVHWSSDNEAVAVVNDAGLVTAVGAGSAEITVTTVDGSYTDSASVTVVDNRPVAESMDASPGSAVIAVGGTQQVNPRFHPAGSIPLPVTWSSSDETIITVSSTGLVTGVSAGRADIIITTVGGEFTTSASITVTGDESDGEVLTTFFNNNASGVGFGDTGVRDTTVFRSAPASWRVNYSADWSVHIMNALDSNIAASEITKYAGEGWFEFYYRSDTNGFIRFVVRNPASSEPDFLGEDGKELVFPVEATDEWRRIQIPFPGWDNEPSPSFSSWQFTIRAWNHMAGATVYYDDISFVVPAGSIAVTGVSVAPTTLNMVVGDTGEVTATVSPANASDPSVTWSSDNTAVATVDENGTVTAVGEGSATITATTVVGEFTGSTTVNVAVPILPPFNELISGTPTGNSNEYISSWFGTFQTSADHHHWVWHEGLDWLYAGFAVDENEMWLWSYTFDGFIYTGANLFPFVQIDEDLWIYYHLAGDGTAIYFDYEVDGWFSLGDADEE